MDTPPSEPTKPVPTGKVPRDSWTSHLMLMLVAVTGMVAGALLMVAGHSFISASSVATTAQLIAAAATSLFLLVVFWKVGKWFLALLRRPSAKEKAEHAPQTSILSDFIVSWQVWRAGKSPNETPLALRPDLGPLLRSGVRYVIITLASMGLLGMAGLLVTLAQLFLTQVQTRRLEAQNRLLVAQNNITAEHQRFEQATALAEAEYNAAEKVLLDVTSPLAMQEQKLNLLPEIAAIQVPVITVQEDKADADNPNDQRVETQVTFPNAPRVRSLLLVYMKLDRVGQLRKEALATHSRSASPTIVTFESEGDLMLDLETELSPLSNVSTALFRALHRLGPVNLKSAKTDAEIAALPSLWKLGGAFSTIERVKEMVSALTAKSIKEHTEPTVEDYKLRSGNYPWDFRHVHPGEFQQVQAPGAEISGARGREAAFPAGADFRFAQIQLPQFIQAELQSAFFNRAQIQGGNFAMAQLQGAHFTVAQLQGTYFHGSQLQGARFYKAQLQGSRFTEANAQEAHFNDAQVQGGNFTQAELRGASFFGSQLQGAVFKDAQVQGAVFREADFSSAKACLQFEPALWSLSVTDEGNVVLPSAQIEYAKTGKWDAVRHRKPFAGTLLTSIWRRALDISGLDKDFAAYIRSVLIYAPEVPIPAKYENDLKLLVAPEVYAKDWERISQPTRLIGAQFVHDDGSGAIHMDAKTKIEWQEALRAEIAETTQQLNKAAKDSEEANETNELLQSAPETLRQLEHAITDLPALEQRKNWFLYKEVQKLREAPANSKALPPMSIDPQAKPSAPK